MGLKRIGFYGSGRRLGHLGSGRKIQKAKTPVPPPVAEVKTGLATIRAEADRLLRLLT